MMPRGATSLPPSSGSPGHVSQGPGLSGKRRETLSGLGPSAGQWASLKRSKDWPRELSPAGTKTATFTCNPGGHLVVVSLPRVLGNSWHDISWNGTAWVGSGQVREKSHPSVVPECRLRWPRQGAGNVGCICSCQGRRAPGIPLGIIRLALFAEAAAHTLPLIRFIIFLTGWMCTSRSRPFGELI